MPKVMPEFKTKFNLAGFDIIRKKKSIIELHRSIGSRIQC